MQQFALNLIKRHMNVFIAIVAITLMMWLRLYTNSLPSQNVEAIMIVDHFETRAIILLSEYVHGMN